MNSIEDFVQAAAQRFGATEDTTRSASSGLLGVIRDNDDGSTFNQLVDRVPGVVELVGAQNEAESGKSGLVGGLMGKAAGLMGRQGGSSAGLLGLLASSGISTSNVGPFVSMFLKFIQQTAGPELSDRVSGSLPNLKDLIG